MVGDAQRHGAARRARLDRAQQLEDVAHPARRTPRRRRCRAARRTPSSPSRSRRRWSTTWSTPELRRRRRSSPAPGAIGGLLARRCGAPARRSTRAALGREHLEPLGRQRRRSSRGGPRGRTPAARTRAAAPRGRGARRAAGVRAGAGCGVAPPRRAWGQPRPAARRVREAVAAELAGPRPAAAPARAGAGGGGASRTAAARRRRSPAGAPWWRSTCGRTRSISRS